MTYSKWYSPSTIAYAEPEGIDFTDGDSHLDRTSNLITVDHLKGFATTGGMVVEGSRAVRFGGWQVDVSSAVGLQLEIQAQRLARIVDTCVSLMQGSVVGANVAVDTSGDVAVYEGMFSSYWRFKGSVDADDFAVLLDFAPRDDMPSSNPFILRSVKLRLILS
jgi:hypothetical protein